MFLSHVLYKLVRFFNQNCVFFRQEFTFSDLYLEFYIPFRCLRYKKSIRFVNSVCINWQLMPGLASLKRFGEDDLVFINWRSCRHCLQNEWPLIFVLIVDCIKVNIFWEGHEIFDFSVKINAEFLRQIAAMQKARLSAHAERLTFIMRKKCWTFF